IYKVLRQSKDPLVQESFGELLSIRRRIAALGGAELKSEKPKMYKKQMAQLVEQKNVLEGKLSRLSKAFAQTQKNKQADAVMVARALPQDAVLIDLARVVMADFKNFKRASPHYIAFIVHAGRGEDVAMVDLGNADAIDKMVSLFRQELASHSANYAETARALYAQLVKPLKEALGNARQLFISPDGPLNLIPFEALQTPDGRFLLEDYRLSYLTAGRDVLRFGKPRHKKNKALLMGDPNFAMGHKQKVVTLAQLAVQNHSENMQTRSFEMDKLHFKRLAGTLEEIKEIQALLGPEHASLYSGDRALEEVLWQHENPHIVHLATHGFFLKDQDLSALPPGPQQRGFIKITRPKKRRPGRIRIENPMLRSGLALAGANHKAEENAGDGLLTAEEVVGLSLDETELVVLSACETGLGKVTVGEGVFGLRRAFIEAGVASLVMSLWQVPDKETRELMTAFYKRLLHDKLPRAEALRQAILEQIQRVKDRYGHRNPFYWAAFVLAGEANRPL
ncbi:MAG: CHAT domain-containing protein, partial [Myxococcota bacterium]|nr:CHAT domain-containing protein [Myxococcota bacterium]